MSKKSKAISKQKNLIAKRAKRAANKAMYESWKRTGENTKSTRFRRGRKKKANSTKGMHLISDCGNIACRKCYEVTNAGVYPIGRPFTVRGKEQKKKVA